MYTLQTPIIKVKGVGLKSAQKLNLFGINTVRDLLLYLPLRYEDRREVLNIKELQSLKTNTTNQPTILAQVQKTSSFYKVGKSIQKAVVSDATAKLNLSWFNSPFILSSLKIGEWYYFSGRYNYGYKTLNQPVVEKQKADEQILTGRLVPIYSSRLGLKQGATRRLLKNILDHLAPIEDQLEKQNFNVTFSSLHFPKQEEDVTVARRRLGLEELLQLIQTAKKHKKAQSSRRANFILKQSSQTQKETYTSDLPFSLTQAQQKALSEILRDLQKSHPMNRLLQGDVGSGKTIVAGLAAQHVVAQKSNVCLIAPTQILAKQHKQTINNLLPKLKTQLVLAGTKLLNKKQPASLYIGTQALINKLEVINPGLIIYDEQHRFGVKQRKQSLSHLLTMTATPIPRSLMLSVFSYLDLSILNELPTGRKLTKTWFVPETKKGKALAWIKEEVIKTHGLALIVCPFIDPSYKLAQENIQAASKLFSELKPFFSPELKTALLHGKIKKEEQEKILSETRSQKIQVLISTSIIEVGMDLPQASIIAIYEAQKFGMASLHQLRGRVGRHNQQGFCLILSNSQKAAVITKLKNFTQISDGQKLAELDLKNRGAGELFGVQQHGFNGLNYASWVDLELIKQAQDLLKTKIHIDWQSQILAPFSQNLLHSTN